MSAVMITMGFYGLARFVPLLGRAAAWWPYLLMVLGAAGALGGIAFALAQRDVKRVLAYSTVENAGIVTLAIGLGLLGEVHQQPALAALGWTAALLHLWNHALAKALLFLGFGAIAQRAGDRSLEALGGLLARWPTVGATLVLGAAAISALPGLNIFASELLLLRGLLLGTVTLDGGAQIVLLGAVAVVAFTGGLAAACFARMVGIGLLGTPRTAGAAGAAQPGWTMRLPLLLLAAACVLVGLMPHYVAGTLATAVASIAPGAATDLAGATLAPVALVAPLIALAAVLFGAIRGWAVARTPQEHAATWGCGYGAATPTMQYTASSFGEPLTRVLQPLLSTSFVRAPAFLSSTTSDRILMRVYLPVFAAVSRAAARLRSYHKPRVSRSLLYIVVTVIVLLALLLLPAVRQ
jgi:formate hydrogenlyase subunit 3/multisubunit Na+/H+ antiporter MnhD subunit